ncbi:ImmA/IrrE family metallo-endopeptidase [Rummeliibacillus sp. POC4]|uniref:ImmA/IrrE family metallo-endopeptidase n=1 Tax=Rummeliibacillus sp. POC4 TaxID=2305899 RepID=UPI00131430E4|nr:ImmA/IrrE family metallo-endopeptidase [Rummeliibacillus sp. POC4]
MTHLEDYIQHFYNQLDIHSPTQLNIDEIAQRLGISIFYWNEGSQALFINNSSFIFLNNMMLPNFKWQEFCHELGHVLLHAGDQIRLPYSFVEYQEFKANNFALHAAAPTFMIDELDLPNTYQEAVRLLQDTFHISLTFACKRLDHYINNHLSLPSQIPW